MCLKISQKGQKPYATPLTINIMGAIAQHERETISKRTKRALAEVKKMGTGLGSHNPKVRAGLQRLWDQKTKVKVEKQQIEKKAKGKGLKKPILKVSKRHEADQKVWPVIRVLRKQGLSWSAVVNELNSLNINSRWGGSWHISTVRRVAQRNM